ncbi:hypothetical protein [Brevibacillus composti]|nr:hypothetical protein [Brevibacillus composti]
MFGIEMQQAPGKLPGFYAQVIHKIGDHVNVYDRDEQLLIVENEQERDKLIEILEKASMLGEEFPLWLLPANAEMADLDAVGFESQDGHLYVYADRVAAFTLDPAIGAERDRWAALEQMKESILGRIPAAAASDTWYLIDSEQDQLMLGIAKAYGVQLHFFAE